MSGRPLSDTCNQTMFLIQSLHPDGQWVDEGVVQLEYWAYQDAQRRCCTEGCSHRILTDHDHQIVAMVTTGSCPTNQQRLQASIS